MPAALDMASNMEEFALQFAPLNSVIDPGFWYAVTEKKLNEWKLDESSKAMTAFYTNNCQTGLPCLLNIDYNSLDANTVVPANAYRCIGELRNFNSFETFKTCDKKQIIEDAGKKIHKSIDSKEVLNDPSLLTKFIMISFADLKKYKYYYWFAFPALCLPQSVAVAKCELLEQHFSSSEVSTVSQTIRDFSGKHDYQQAAAFILLSNHSTSTFDVMTLNEFHELEKTLKDGGGNDERSIYLVFADPCTLPTNPGWTLRNFLYLAVTYWADTLCGGRSAVKVLCYRDRFVKGERDMSHSLVLTLNISSSKDESGVDRAGEPSSQQPQPKVVGWERNEQNKLSPRMVSLASSMDPVRLSESAVGLNLKLMRWRLMPSLDLDVISSTRCLLLGAGTLGCNVARCLMGWGVKHITFVDNGKVSYSNPVRQTLFNFDDSKNGGKWKAEAAAEALKRIYPGMGSTVSGEVLSIPMPGHPLSEVMEEEVRSEVARLEELVSRHDVVFLLLDTRESRWLPTLLAAAKHKLVINAALGFDTYMVVRHGVRRQCGNPATATTSAAAAPSVVNNSSIPGDRLGCYFCNDVVAPGDSTRDRTLDQQCTVSRPGMSMLVSALAVELLVTLLQHPLQGEAPADTSLRDEHFTMDTVSPLGLVPHQIRGFLSRFYQLLPATEAFDKCTACSQSVIDAYNKDGFTFLVNAFNDPQYLERLTGLTQLHEDTSCAEVWDFSDDESV